MKTLFAAFLLLALAPFTLSQPKKDKPAPVPAAAGEPTLTTPVTLGLLRGKTADVELTGTNLQAVTSVVVIDCKPDVTAKIKSRDSNKLIVSFTVPEVAPIGLYQLRVAGPSGISAYRPIIIDSAPIVRDNGKNNRPADAQPLTWPCVVTGWVSQEMADYYRISVKAGQTVTFDCFAKRLGSALDPVIILGDAKTGRELSSLYADDTPGLQSDARFVHTFPTDGEYVVMVRDSTYKGGEKFDYRLRITEGPAALIAYPPFTAKGLSQQYEFISQTNVKIPISSAMMAQEGWLPVGSHAWPVPVWKRDRGMMTEMEPNDTVETATPMPGGITARFEKKNDRDFFTFPAQKGKVYDAIAKTAEIGSACEVLLKIQDRTGKTLAESDPQKTVAKAEFTAPDDGPYFVVCEHLNFLFGPAEIYHLTVNPRRSRGFDMMPGSDRLIIPRGSFGLLPISSIENVIGMDKELTPKIQSDFLTLSPPTISTTAKPTKENPVYLPIHFQKKPNREPQENGSTIGSFTIHDANVSEIVRTGLNGLTYLPPGWSDRIAVFEVPTAPLTLKIPENLTLKAGANGKVKITATRKEYDGDIVISLLGMPTNVTAKSVTIKTGQFDCEFDIVADGKAVAGEHAIFVRGQVAEKITHVGPMIFKLTVDAKPAEPKPAPPKKQ